MASEPLQKVTMNLFDGDYARVQALFPDIGAGPIIRRLIRAFLAKAELADEPNPEIEVHL